MSNYYTVSQYAAVFGKDPGNIRRMLLKGILHGEKVGSQWLIPKETSYPADKRIKEGNYHNWRQRTKLNSKHPEMVKKLSEMCEVIRDIYAGALVEIVLYGSYARGQETNESDVDMAVMLLSEQTEEQYDKMTEVIVDYQLDLGVTLSMISINHHEFMEWKTTIPFYKNVEKEGIVLWKSA